ncbi:MAG: hypothetical protein K6B44_02420 [Lachnospiraceae bacterium]|nr:hypothetical protein [Lachnospiraceae bacterium]
MKSKVLRNVFRILTGMSLSIALLASPAVSAPMSVYATDDGEDETQKDELEKLRRLGDYAGTEDLREQVRNSGFNTQTTGTASKPDSSSPTSPVSGPGSGKVTTGVDPTTGMKTVTTEASLSETYHQDYDTYELSINGRFFFYSNVGNGDITSEAVTLEMPANIFFTCEKDGVPYSVQSGKRITEKGTYVLNLTATETQVDTIYIYTAVYRFRIAERAAGTGNGDGMSTDVPYDIDEEPGLLDPQVPETQAEEEFSAPDEEFEDSGLTDEEKAALNEILKEDDADDGLDDIPEIMADDGSINMEDLSKELNADGIYTTEGINKATGMASSYDYTTGYYKNTLRNSMSFYSDVPNGMVTKREVTLRSTDDLTFTVYKDGVPYEFDPEKKINELGSYTVIPVAEDVVYYDAYQSETPVFSFRIIGDAVNDLSVYRAPEGFKIDKILVDGLETESVKMMGQDAALLREDGRYKVTITDGDRYIDLDFLLDRVRPRFYVSVEKNKASMYYKSTDVRETVIYKDGELISSGSIQNQVKKPGNYEVIAYDRAGNKGTSIFKVKYGFNSGAIVAIVLVIAAAAGIIAYIRYINSKIKVR